MDSNRQKRTETDRDLRTETDKSGQRKRSKKRRVICHVSHETRVACHLSLTPTATNTDPPSANSPTMRSRLVQEKQKTKQKLKQLLNQFGKKYVF